MVPLLARYLERLRFGVTLERAIRESICAPGKSEHLQNDAHVARSKPR